MFGFRRRREKPPAPPKGKEYRCSFCNKSQREVLKLIAGPNVYICDECVDICNQIVAEPRKDAPTEGPMLTAWCALCRRPIDAEPALLVEKRGVLCPQCVADIEASLDARNGS